MKSLLSASVLVLTLFGPVMRAQDGTDINKAIPIFFGQIISDTIDATTRPRQVYRITLAKGQQFSASMTIAAARPVANIGIHLFPPSIQSIQNFGCPTGTGAPAVTGQYGQNSRAVTFSYLVAPAGDYFVMVCPLFSTGVQYELQVKADGTPINVPNPVQAGCLLGRVDYITYSLQLIAAGLPDEVSIGGVKACTTCQVKAPKYPELASRIENALRSKVNVEACYDGGGDIFQLKLVQP